MARKHHTAEQIIGKLRQAEVILGQGGDLEYALREIGVTKNTFYRWRKEYGGLKLDQARRMKGGGGGRERGAETRGG
ncbi:MAG: transposase [Micavibrio sp.]|nr:transposase [Micavibrio sp.]